jgi:hypothetical protein
VDAAGPPPTNERRRSRAVLSNAENPTVVNEMVSGHCASVGVTEIEEKNTEKKRKYAYYEALLAAEDTHINNEPVDVREARTRPDWKKWEKAMNEELQLLE